MFHHRLKVQLHHTDSYGIIFFANQLIFCHDAFQAFLESIGIDLLPHRPVSGAMLVVVHAESDHSAPIVVGDTLDVALRIAAIGTTSLTVSFELHNQRAQLVGRAKTVHVTIEASTNAKTPLPPAWRSAFSAHLA